MNKIFQEYKKCKIVLVDEIPIDIELKPIIFEPKEIEKKKYNRAKAKEEFRKEIEEWDFD